MIKRKDYKGIFVEGQTTICKNTMQVFGWVVQQYICPVGTKIAVVSKDEVSTTEVPNRTYYVRGLGTAVNDRGTPLNDRIPGWYSCDRSTVPAGISTTTIVEELEFWCVSALLNKRKVPELTPIANLTASQSNIPVGSKVLVCRGNIDDKYAGEEFVVTNATQQLGDNTYALIFDREFSDV